MLGEFLGKSEVGVSVGEGFVAKALGKVIICLCPSRMVIGLRNISIFFALFYRYGPHELKKIKLKK